MQRTALHINNSLPPYIKKNVLDRVNLLALAEPRYNRCSGQVILICHQASPTALSI